MYYEERVVDNILCYRYGPNSEWTQFTVEELTTKFVNLNEEWYKKIGEEELRKASASLEAGA